MHSLDFLTLKLYFCNFSYIVGFIFIQTVNDIWSKLYCCFILCNDNNVFKFVCDVILLYSNFKYF